MFNDARFTADGKYSKLSVDIYFQFWTRPVRKLFMLYTPTAGNTSNVCFTETFENSQTILE